MMNPPVWATHEVSWNTSRGMSRVWVCEGGYQYYEDPSRDPDLDYHNHEWGPNDWLIAIGGFEKACVQPINISVENE